MKSINSQSARNAGIAAVGFAAMLITFQWIGYYALLASFAAGCASYANNVYFNNDQSRTDPIVTLGGGLLAAAFIYARHHL